jgi:hypothetical protein
MADEFKKQAELLRKRLLDTIDKFKRYNNYLAVANLSETEINKVLNKFEEQLTASVIAFIEPKKVEKFIDVALKDFKESMRDFITLQDKAGRLVIPRKQLAKELLLQRALSKQLPGIEKLDIRRATKEQFFDQLSSVIKRQRDFQAQKFKAFKVQRNLAKVSKKQIDELGKRVLKSVKIGEDTFDDAALKDIWDDLTESYGRFDTVTYSDGKQMPLRTYVDMRKTTTQTQITKTVSQVTAAKRGIYSLKINSTGTNDSCIYHEQEIVLTSETARKLWLAEWKGDKEVQGLISRLKTLAVVENDDTHLFKPNCRHRARPFPLQYTSRENIISELKKSLNRQSAPKKVNETKVKKQIDSGKLKTAA